MGRRWNGGARRVTVLLSALGFTLLLGAHLSTASAHPSASASAQVPETAGQAPDALTGTIQGRVVIQERPARRTADRYPGAGGAPSRSEASVPVVVHLEGARGGARASGPLRMVQRDTAFAPELLVVPVGSTVEFPNEDAFFHNVFSYSRPKRFDLGRYPRGESKSVEFDAPGYVKVFCEVHEWMRGGVMVVESPHFAVVEGDGTFRLSDVPPGTYTLVATDFERGTAEAQVTVRSGETASAELRFR